MVEKVFLSGFTLKNKILTVYSIFFGMAGLFFSVMLFLNVGVSKIKFMSSFRYVFWTKEKSLYIKYLFCTFRKEDKFENVSTLNPALNHTLINVCTHRFYCILFKFWYIQSIIPKFFSFLTFVLHTIHLINK